MIQNQRKCEENKECQEKAAQREHHQKAAECHEHAAEHHRDAAKCHESGDPKTAAHHAHIAHGHSAHAVEQEGECCKKYATCCENL